MKTVGFGSRYFKIAVTLREAHLINGMLSSRDILYGLKNKEVEQFEEVDKMLIINILNAPISSCIESLYLELGLTPITIILKSITILWTWMKMRCSTNSSWPSTSTLSKMTGHFKWCKIARILEFLSISTIWGARKKKCIHKGVENQNKGIHPWSLVEPQSQTFKNGQLDVYWIENAKLS